MRYRNTSTGIIVNIADKVRLGDKWEALDESPKIVAEPKPEAKKKTTRKSK